MVDEVAPVGDHLLGQRHLGSSVVRPERSQVNAEVVLSQGSAEQELQLFAVDATQPRGVSAACFRLIS